MCHSSNQLNRCFLLIVLFPNAFAFFSTEKQLPNKWLKGCRVKINQGARISPLSYLEREGWALLIRVEGENRWLTVDRTPARQPPHQSFTWSKDLYFSQSDSDRRKDQIRFLKVWEMRINVDIYSLKLQRHKGPNGHFTQAWEQNLVYLVPVFSVLCLFAFRGKGHCCCGFCDLLARLWQ